MISEMEKPAFAALAVPAISLAAGKTEPEFNPTPRNLQVSRLTRRCAISIALACAVAPLLYGEAAH